MAEPTKSKKELFPRPPRSRWRRVVRQDRPQRSVVRLWTTLRHGGLFCLWWRDLHFLVSGRCRLFLSFWCLTRDGWSTRAALVGQFRSNPSTSVGLFCIVYLVYSFPLLVDTGRSANCRFFGLKPMSPYSAPSVQTLVLRKDRHGGTPFGSFFSSCSIMCSFLPIALMPSRVASF